MMKNRDATNTDSPIESQVLRFIDKCHSKGFTAITLCYESNEYLQEADPYKKSDPDKALILIKTYAPYTAPLYYVWNKGRIALTTPNIEQAVETYNHLSQQLKIRILRNNRNKTNGQYEKLRPVVVDTLRKLRDIALLQDKYIDTFNKISGNCDALVEAMSFGKYVTIAAELISALTKGKVQPYYIEKNISWYAYETAWGNKPEMCDVEITKQDGTTFTMCVDSFDKLFDLIFDVEER